jgi:ELP3 family radical SAM enzyme/protein acetyltransferase
MTDIEDLFSANDDTKNNAICKLIIKDLIVSDPKYYANHEILQKTLVKLSRKYKLLPSKRNLSVIYREMNKKDPIKYPILEKLRTILITRAVRSDSGILNISVSMPPDKFSCRYNCHFCPNEPGMPRSYLSNEDVFLRASKVNFDAVAQVKSRLEALEENGHPIDKLEFRILGGTFSCYTHDIADHFIRDLYYAANTYFDTEPRDRLSLIDEQLKNEHAKVHVVGIGIETRPDEINENEIIRFRNYGITRVEIGVQHTDDNILKGVNRGHGLKQSIRAIKLLKNYGFKVEIHIMTDLPGSTPEIDMDCYKQVLCDNNDLIPDYMKDYPCLDVSFTEIKKWREEGKWVPYSDKNNAEDLKRVLIYRQLITPPWVRVNRIQRDFRLSNNDGNLGYTSDTIKPNLAEIVKREAENEGIYCQCIRCREVRTEEFNPADIKYITHSFIASGGLEYFISAEIVREKRNLLLGFIRLRFSSSLRFSIIDEIKGETAMIRELHVYGRVKEVGSRGRSQGAQHLGIGKKLISIAEKIALENSFKKMAIISGVGVRDYYRKYGYEKIGSYMIKSLQYPNHNIDYMLIISMCLIGFSIVIAFFGY